MEDEVLEEDPVGDRCEGLDFGVELGLEGVSDPLWMGRREFFRKRCDGEEVDACGFCGGGGLA